MHPVAHSLVSHSRLCLGYLTLMVREDEIHASTVYVKLLAEVFPAHRGALTVPSREALANGIAGVIVAECTHEPRPTHDVLRLCLLPQGKVGLVFLLTHTGQSVSAGIFDIL